MGQYPQQCAVNFQESPPAYDAVIEGLEADKELPTYSEAVTCVIEETKSMEALRE